MDDASSILDGPMITRTWRVLCSDGSRPLNDRGLAVLSVRSGPRKPVAGRQRPKPNAPPATHAAAGAATAFRPSPPSLEAGLQASIGAGRPACWVLAVPRTRHAASASRARGPARSPTLLTPHLLSGRKASSPPPVQCQCGRQAFRACSNLRAGQSQQASDSACPLARRAAPWRLASLGTKSTYASRGAGRGPSCCHVHFPSQDACTSPTLRDTATSVCMAALPHCLV